MTLKGKTALITGGSKGIGHACAIALAEQGANVIINYAHDDKDAKATAEAASKFGVKTLIVRADIASQDKVEQMFREIKTAFATIDVLVNNAGITAKIRVTNLAREMMSHGKIIFISSIHGKLGHGRPNVIGYSAAKAALDSYMKNLAKAGHLIKRWIEPSEIADGVVFLAKNDAVCGEVLVIDGGMSLKVLG
jgi:3-oxoacyl-[acyl-carrier protein] reductase